MTTQSQFAPSPRVALLSEAEAFLKANPHIQYFEVCHLDGRGARAANACAAMNAADLYLWPLPAGLDPGR